MTLLFLLTLPLANPWVRGDGVGYYAYARSLLVEHRLDFSRDWLAANPTYRAGRVDEAGHIRSDQYTRTGHLDNHFSVGPAILWTPFLLPVHFAILAADKLGAKIPADGFSRPYLIAMALSTALYGLLGLWFSFDLARSYVPSRWAFLATVGIWFASSLPVYMYFNPSWSHVHSAFAVALFLWYWHRTRPLRTNLEWVLLGLLGGLMVDMYYPNVVFLLVPAAESLLEFRADMKVAPRQSQRRLMQGNLAFVLALLAAFSPSVITRWVIYGSPLISGYIALGDWNWAHPQLGPVLIAADHGLFSWTPILLPAFLGLFALWRRDRLLSGLAILCALAYYYLIASYPSWDGLASFGNRFFISLTSVFILGLAGAFDWMARHWRPARVAAAFAWGFTAALIFWNLSFIYQWGMHLVPARGPISWREMMYNQTHAVPAQFGQSVKSYFERRSALMRSIEERDMRALPTLPAASAQRK